MECINVFAYLQFPPDHKRQAILGALSKSYFASLSLPHTIGMVTGNGLWVRAMELATLRELGGIHAVFKEGTVWVS